MNIKELEEYCEKCRKEISVIRKDLIKYLEKNPVGRTSNQMEAAARKIEFSMKKARRQLIKHSQGGLFDAEKV
jgi:ribosome recycling factor